MKLTSTDLADRHPIPEVNAFGKFDATSNVALSANISPQLTIVDAPEGTRSFAILCVDIDVPSAGDDVNKAGRTVPHSLPRVDFYHWVLVDLPASVNEVSAGEFAEGVVARGKPGPDGGPHGVRQGLNDYTGWFAGDSDMEGQYFGYDGPCPPWNDELVHRYRLSVYALDCARCAVDGDFTGADVLLAIDGHVLAKAELLATYKIYPEARPHD